MGKKVTLIYTIFSILFFIALALLLYLRIDETRGKGIKGTTEHFLGVSRYTRDAIESEIGFGSYIFKQSIGSFFSQDPRLELLSISSKTDGFEYIRTDKYSYLDNRRPEEIFKDPGFTFTHDPLREIIFSEPLRTDDGEEYIVEGIYTILSVRDIFPLIKDTLIIILIFTIVTIVVAIILFTSRPLEEESSAAGYRRETPYSASYTPAEEPSVEAAPGTEVEDGEEEELLKPLPEEEGAEEPQPLEPLTMEPQKHSAPQTEQKGLFSPESGLGWQDYLEKRLTLELERSAYNEQDLTIVFIKFTGVGKGDARYRKAAQLIIDQFTFEDLAFEFGDDTFCVIFPNINLDSALKMMENFTQSLKEHPDETALEGCRCGLSSRNGRLVSGKRLIKEASFALGKTAGEGEDAIIGFRPDPGKYRDYISKS